VNVDFLMKDAPLFAALSTEDQQLLASRMRLEQYHRDEIIFAKGDPSRALYLIQSGWVKLVAERGAVVANLGPGSLAGETDLFLGRPRTLEARATSEVELLTLSGHNLEALMSSRPELGLSLSIAFGTRVAQLRGYLVDKRLKNLPFLAELPNEEVEAVADCLYLKEFRKGAFVFQVGQSPNAMYIVESGPLRLVDSSSEEEEFVDLQPGTVFGEAALLMGIPYSVAAYATDAVVVWTLDTADFEQLCEQYPSIRTAFSRNIRVPLGPQDRILAVDMLNKIQLFVDLQSDTLRGVAGRLVLCHVPAGELVFAENEPGDAMYIVRSGEVKVYSSSGLEGEVLATLKQGEFFGEMALLTGKSRTTAVRAARHANLLALYRSDFDELLVQYPSLSLALSKTLSQRLAESGQSFADRHLARIPILSSLSRPELSDVAERVRPVRYRAGELIFAQDTPGEVMYFIESGQIRIAAKIGQKLTTLAVLGRGEFFGEAALLTGNLRNALAQAVNDVDLWAVYKKDLDELMRKYPQLAIGIGRTLSQRLSRTTEVLTEGRVTARVAVTSPAAAAELPKAIPARTATGRGAVAATAGVAATTGAPVNASQAAAQPRSGKASQTTTGSQRTTARLTGSAVKAKPGEKQSQAGPRLGTRMFDKLASASAWFAASSVSTKLQLVGVLLLFVWLCGISAPATMISAFSTNDVGLSKMAFLQTVTPTPTDTPIPTPTSTVTPTPTNTPTPTDTPIPTATFTPIPPTATPIPTDTPTRRPQPVVPTNTPTPAAPTPTPVPDVDYKLVKVRRLTACENRGGHNIYVNVTDKDGNGIPGVKVWVSWGPDGVDLTTGSKPERGPGWADFPMYKGTHSVQVKGARSEIATGITPDIPVDEPCEDSTTANSLYHYSYEVVFQRTF